MIIHWLSRLLGLDLVTVIRVVDGDTIVTTKGRVRIAYIDAPEIDQSYGEESKAYLERLILNQKVRLEVLGNERHGRILAVVYGQRGCVDTGLTLVRRGWARDYTTYSHGKYANEEAQAKKERLGIWQNGHNEEPWKYRKRIKEGR